ncbi:hypothetical protein ATO6_17250 [Oceanicola sp. 22II-s10i]|uniref:hypothetical protein n=1 Tax=Oceanicola sp. 22II-s10i TaxID=1317116 RepID=UPI000B523BB5|nr:hypothetical protein [Oceanicola sp. 22II-s10i]OWU83614.1 hypothetical protein ATO6_17250 [Oceanicola sp. 22II-s10i]
MTNQTRIHEHDTDRLFIGALQRDPAIAAAFRLALGEMPCPVRDVRAQIRHETGPGTIDIDIVYDDGLRLMIENKVDAEYGPARRRATSAMRYRRSAQACRDTGTDARCVLLAPGRYLAAARDARGFDACISYEHFAPLMSGACRNLLDAAIEQAETPFSADEALATCAFFHDYRRYVEDQFPMLVLKPDPKKSEIRPDGAYTLHFDARRTLVRHDGLPDPGMSLQCRDGSAPKASVRITLRGWGRFATVFEPSPTMEKIGAYLRPASQSLGITIDTPRLDTQRPFADQVPEAVAGLEAARNLRAWWLDSRSTIQSWADTLEGA